VQNASENTVLTCLSFLEVANEEMCRPIRSLTEGRGYNARNHRLAVFGGAAGQHACSIARNLRIKTVVIHKYSSILSAYGMVKAKVVHEGLEPSSETYCSDSLLQLQDRLAALQSKVTNESLSQGFQTENLQYERYLNMRYQGTNTSLMILEPADGDFEEAFLKRHLVEFSFTVPGRPILIDDVRVRGMAVDAKIEEERNLVDQIEEASSKLVPLSNHPALGKVYFKSTGWVDISVYALKQLPLSVKAIGPAVSWTLLRPLLSSLVLSPLF
jgi:5-oxoprolinase (ATP-hydrolysing)